jgi:hypothetical protein
VSSTVDAGTDHRASRVCEAQPCPTCSSNLRRLRTVEVDAHESAVVNLGCILSRRLAKPARRRRLDSHRGRQACEGRIRYRCRFAGLRSRRRCQRRDGPSRLHRLARPHRFRRLHAAYESGRSRVNLADARAKNGIAHRGGLRAVSDRPLDNSDAVARFALQVSFFDLVFS